jgi:hypothetical protein
MLMEEQDAQHIFETTAKDPQQWLMQARQLKLSADVLGNELRSLIPMMKVTLGMPPWSETDS